jgi:hypothetical protein
MRTFIAVLAILSLCASPATAYININHDRIAKAEEIIINYVSEKYGWNETAYEIFIDAKKLDEDIIHFEIYHKEDKHPTPVGGGKSFLVIFDMNKMEVQQEIRRK